MSRDLTARKARGQKPDVYSTYQNQAYAPSREAGLVTSKRLKGLLKGRTSGAVDLGRVNGIPMRSRREILSILLTFLADR
jgi:hypothetical protein